MKKHIQALQIDNWAVQARIPSSPGPHPVMLMLHGWRGDEYSMWVFSEKIPDEYLVIAPRGIYPAPNGYSWVERPPTGFSNIDGFRPAAESLIDLLALRPGAPNQNFTQVSLMGFSQGAALSVVFAALYPDRVNFLAALAGFVPEGLSSLISERPFLNKNVFVAHGTQDDIVPVEMARSGIQILQSGGAEVTYCEDEIGHKMGISCLRGLENLLKPSGFHKR